MIKRDTIKKHLEIFNANVVSTQYNPKFRLEENLSGVWADYQVRQRIEDRYQHVYVHPYARQLTYNRVREILLSFSPWVSIQRVNRCPHHPDSHGVSDLDHIWIRKNANPYFEAITLLHEYVHVIDRHGAEPVGFFDAITGTYLLKREIIAETTAYLVAKELGLERADSVEYVAHYLYNICGDIDRSILDKYASHIEALAYALVTRIEEKITQPISA